MIKCFSIDVNSDPLGNPAAPSLYASARAGEHIRWCRDLGANAVQTFCVSLNGFAWYRSRVAPVTPDPGGDYLPEMIARGHAAGMAVHGYFCLAGNAWFRSRNRDRLCSGIDWRKNIPLSSEYLDYFCRVAEEAVRMNELDGVLIDWFEEIPPLWVPAEKRIYEEVMGRPFPAEPAGPPKPVPGVDTGEAVVPRFVGDEEETAFRREATIRAWRRVREAVKSARPGCAVWLNIPFREPAEPIWAGSPVLRETDMMLTERCDLRIARWLDAETGGKPVLVNLGGLGRFTADSWRDVAAGGFHFFGYARPDAATLLPDLDAMPRLAGLREAFGAGNG